VTGGIIEALRNGVDVVVLSLRNSVYCSEK